MTAPLFTARNTWDRFTVVDYVTLGEDVVAGLPLRASGLSRFCTQELLCLLGDKDNAEVEESLM
ncbi:MAG: hypothetical protein WCD37_14425 [Chloroflexia bacterium]